MPELADARENNVAGADQLNIAETMNDHLNDLYAYLGRKINGKPACFQPFFQKTVALKNVLCVDVVKLLVRDEDATARANDICLGAMAWLNYEAADVIVRRIHLKDSPIFLSTILVAIASVVAVNVKR